MNINTSGNFDTKVPLTCDTKVPFLRVIDSKRRLKNFIVSELEPTHRIVFTKIDYKKLLTNTTQSNSIELRTEKGQLVLFSGTGKVILTLQVKRLSRKLDSYYANQATSLSPFLDIINKEEMVFVAQNGRAALPPARSFILPTAKRVGKELLK